MKRLDGRIGRKRLRSGKDKPRRPLGQAYIGEESAGPRLFGHTGETAGKEGGGE